MSYVKQVKIKGKDYWYLFHTIREGDKFLKKSKYLGKELPKNIDEIKSKFEEELKKEPKENKLVDSLSPLERKVIPFLKEKKLSKIVEKSGLKDVEVMRALQWLENKELIKTKKEVKEIIELDVNGEKSIKNGLPEKRFLKELNKEKELSEIKNLNKDEINVSLGLLKKRELIQLGKKIKKLKDSDKILELTEDFLKKLPLDISKLKDEEKFVYEELKKRKGMIKERLVKERHVELTKLGEEISKQDLKVNLIEALNSDMLVNGTWKGKRFRRYDVKINVPQIFGAKKQHYRRFLDEIRQKFMALGFSEMTGPLVETDFWNMDALFMPQFHSARDIHDAYYIKEPKYGKLDEKIVEKVKQAHENGFNTGSKGWQYKFDLKRTHRHLLRTQGTALSARTLANKDLEIPGKYFAIARCFRYDVIDATHLADFNQVEGIVVEKGLNIKHLFGLLEMFAREFAGAEEIKIMPGYFPFTEPSATLYAKHPEMGWLELGGSGIFRPEMTKPLGVNIPVIAWGIGIDRIAMFKLGIKDIRELFSHDLNTLRNIKCQQ